MVPEQIGEGMGVGVHPSKRLPVAWESSPVPASVNLCCMTFIFAVLTSRSYNWHDVRAS